MACKAIGCEISFQPDLKDDALVEAIGKQSPDVLVVRGTKVTEPMLAAGSDQAGRARRRRLQHHRRRRRFAARHLRFKLSRQKFDRRRRAGVCVDSRA